MAANRDLKTELFEQIETLGKERSLLPFSEASIDATMVRFNASTLEAIEFLGQSNWTLPELKIPVLDLLQNEALWITSYLDEDTQIRRGATGNLFVFRR